MKTQSVLIAIALFASGCASSTPEPQALDFSAAYLKREVTRGSSPASPSPETTAGPTALQDPEGTADLPGPYGVSDEIRGILSSSEDRLEELREVSSDDARLAAFLSNPVSEEDLAALAWLRSPGVVAARDRVEAARTSYRQSVDLEDLVAVYRSFLRDTEVRVGPERSRREAGAIAPSPGVTQISMEIAGRTVEMAFQDLRAAVRDAAARAMRLHADAARLREARTIVAEEVRLEDQLVRVLRSRFEAGRGGQAGVLTFESRLERLRTDLAVLGEQESAIRSAWNALLNRPEDAPASLLVVPASPVMLPSTGETGALVARALRERPEYRTALLAEERAALAVRLAETMTLPRMDVGSSRFERERAGEAGAQRGATFPAPGRMVMPRADFGVREAQVQEMRARASSMGRAREAMGNRVANEVSQAAFTVDAARRRIETLEREVLPRAERALAASRAGYEADRESYLDLLEAVRRLLDARLGLADGRRELTHAKALLLESTGVVTTRR